MLQACLGGLVGIEKKVYKALRYLIAHLCEHSQNNLLTTHSTILNLPIIFCPKMKASTIFSLFVAYAATASAIPVKQRDHQVEITFIGAANAQFTQSISTDGSTVSIGMPLVNHALD